MNSFEDELLADLMREHGGELAAVRRPGVARRGAARPVAVTAGAVGLVGVVALGVNTIGTGTPAYAVTRGPDGTITVSLRDISGVDGANAQLRRLGVPAVAVPMSRHCTTRVVPDERAPWRGPIAGSAGTGGSGSVTFNVGWIPAGDTMVLAARVAGGHVALSVTIVRGSGSMCVPEAPMPSGNGARERATMTGTGGDRGTETGGSGPTARVSPPR